MHINPNGRTEDLHDTITFEVVIDEVKSTVTFEVTHVKKVSTKHFKFNMAFGNYDFYI